MATKLDKTIKREIEIDGQAYMIGIYADRREDRRRRDSGNGPEMTWKQILSSGAENPS